MSGAALKQAVFQTKHGATRTSTEVLMERSICFCLLGPKCGAWLTGSPSSIKSGLSTSGPEEATWCGPQVESPFLLPPPIVLNFMAS